MSIQQKCEKNVNTSKERDIVVKRDVIKAYTLWDAPESLTLKSVQMYSVFPPADISRESSFFFGKL